MKTKIILFFLFVTIIFTSFSQDKSSHSIFKQRTFYKPFASEISSTLNNISVGGTSHLFSNGNEKQAPLMEIHLGMDAPLLLVSNRNYKWAISTPVSLHVLWAPFEETTAPIINNDYRFGLSFTGIAYLNRSHIKNLSFKLTPFAHESTHLGDELTIFGLENYDQFYRVNVSYEYYELGLTINDPDTLTGNLLSMKFGFMGLINPTKGYYSFSESEIGGRTFYPSQRWAEYYIQLNYRKTEGFLASKTWHPTLSIEARNRVKYEYENPDKEPRVWCINAFIGYDYVPKKTNNIKSVGHYFRFYNGINPHGQFRNGNYRFLGYSFLVYI